MEMGETRVVQDDDDDEKDKMRSLEKCFCDAQF